MLEKCSECGGESKYRCPGCSRCTCSVECVGKHKLRFECNGHRPSTSFVSKSAYDEGTFMADLTFLESAPLPTELADSDHGRKCDELVAACKKRGIHLQKLPKAFTKNKENETIIENDQILWTLKIYRGSLSESGDIIVDWRAGVKYVNIGENDLLARFFDGSSSVYLKLEKCAEKYYRLHQNETLFQVLNAKTIIEFPDLVKIKH